VVAGGNPRRPILPLRKSRVSKSETVDNKGPSSSSGTDGQPRKEATSSEGKPRGDAAVDLSKFDFEDPEQVWAFLDNDDPQS
jgi:hypothetical protein